MRYSCCCVRIGPRSPVESGRQRGHWQGEAQLNAEAFFRLLAHAIESLNVEQARKEVEVFVRDPGGLAIWSRDFFHDIVRRIEVQI